MIGLGTMGRNFLLNVAEHGFSGAGFDLDESKRNLLLDEGKSFELSVGATLDEFLGLLESPRKIMILVPAQVVDVVINQLLDKLDAGDIVIDGGNSHFPDTERRAESCAAKGLEFLGVGVSGGEEGARHGASIMIGGNPAIYEHVRPFFEAASAKVDGESCAAFVGASSSGHFVKMVHNGIEYGLMQIIAETYDYMKRVLKMDDSAMSATFAAWNDAELNSFLIEITAQVLKKKDPETGNPLVEMVLDKAAQKGTGKWTSQAAMDLGVPIPTIDTAVAMRQISARKETRVALGAKLASPKTAQFEADETSIGELKNALLASFIVTYAQGMAMLGAASAERAYGLDLAGIAKIWRGGCIIRSSLLEAIRKAFAASPGLENLLLDDTLGGTVRDLRGDWQKVSARFSEHGLPALCLNSALGYFDAFTSERLPANLIQSQRDFFGAHTYERVDRAGVCHTPDWNE